MNSAECNQRAAACAANAALATAEAVSQEFLRLAAQWRAMAVREIFLGHIDVAAKLAIPPPPAL